MRPWLLGSYGPRGHNKHWALMVSPSFAEPWAFMAHLSSNEHWAAWALISLGPLWLSPRKKKDALFQDVLDPLRQHKPFARIDDSIAQRLADPSQ